ncbi:MAG: acyltransferase [Pseudomonadota bacterium]
MTKLKSVQALRAIAALLVFGCHLISIEARHAERDTFLTYVMENGAYGVDLFFVISGFIMVWVAGDTPQSLKHAGDFFYARVTRIYPLWWLFAGALAVFYLLFRGVPWDAVRLAQHNMEGIPHLIKSFALWPQTHHPILGVGWTLVHEMYFYVGFALLIMLLPVRWRMTGLLIWGATVLAGGFAGLATAYGGTLFELAFNLLTLEFVFGAMVGYMIKAGWRSFAWSSLWIGLAAWLIAFFLINNHTGGLLLAPLNLEQPATFQLMWGRVFLFGLPSAAILYGIVALELDQKLDRWIPNALVNVGDWSYALYLCHVITIGAIGRAVYALLSPDDPASIAIYIIVSTVFTLTIAWLSYRWVERPLIHFFRKWRTAPPQRQGPPSTATV